MRNFYFCKRKCFKYCSAFLCIVIVGSIIRTLFQIERYISYNSVTGKLTTFKINANDFRNSCSDKNKIKVQYSNTYWQVLTGRSFNFYIYGAYYDKRLSSHDPAGDKHEYARLFGVSDAPLKRKRGLGLLCQFWYSNDNLAPAITKTMEPVYIWPYQRIRKGFPIIPYLISCPLPISQSNVSQSLLPTSVSLVQFPSPCRNATNELKLWNIETPNKQEKRKPSFGVCVKGLSFPSKDLSIRLIEWIELLKILGVNKVYVYLFEIEANTLTVLNFYQSEGFVEIIPTSQPGNLPNEPLERNKYLQNYYFRKGLLEIIVYNDCYYRNLYKHDYIVPLDIDEVIVPKTGNTWPDIVKYITSSNKYSKFASFNAIHRGYFAEGISGLNFDSGVPRYMHMLQHVTQIPTFQWNLTNKNNKIFKRSKPFIPTNNKNQPLVAYNHWILLCSNPHPTTNCPKFPIPTNVANLHHYSEFQRLGNIGSSNKNCSSLACVRHIQDKTIWKYKDKLIREVEKVIKSLALNVKD